MKHVDWKQTNENEWQGVSPYTGVRLRKTRDDDLGITAFFVANGFSDWQFVGSVKEPVDEN